jgi:Uma2 family endonuclease
MTAAPNPRLMTADELLRLPDDGKRYELSRGRLICMSPSAVPPGVVAAKLAGRLVPFVDEHDLGVCGTADSGFKLESAPDTVRAPDFWFVRKERISAEGLPPGFWPGAPDLAVEVLSPSDRFLDVMLKMDEYLQAGTRLVWVLDPYGRTAGVFRADGTRTLMGEDGVLDGEDLLPGFRIPLRDLLP